MLEMPFTYFFSRFAEGSRKVTFITSWKNSILTDRQSVLLLAFKDITQSVSGMLIKEVWPKIPLRPTIYLSDLWVVWWSCCIGVGGCGGDSGGDYRGDSGGDCGGGYGDICIEIGGQLWRWL